MKIAKVMLSIPSLLVIACWTVVLATQPALNAIARAEGKQAG